MDLFVIALFVFFCWLLVMAIVDRICKAYEYGQMCKAVALVGDKMEEVDKWTKRVQKNLLNAVK